MKLGIVGPGRLGRSLQPLWVAAGHEVTLHGRDTRPEPSVDVIVLTVPDRVIAEVAATLPVGPLILHTSGATSLAALAPHLRRASLHPLMSFPGPDVALPDVQSVPAAIDAARPEDLEQVRSLVADLGMVPFEVPGDRRLYHAAAVIAGNFATTLLAEAGRCLEAAGVDPITARTMLAPLATRSITQAIADPRGALTGPIARGDVEVVSAHRDALSAHDLDDLRTLYDVLAHQTATWTVKPPIPEAETSHDADD